ncbi:hypothetical protein MNBD_ALPHA06-1118, partial [hydrothermal vent metagenome]
VKADAVGETFTLKPTKGSVSDQGTASVEIDLASIETGISIRNERMREHLFETGKWATAKISGQVDFSNLPKLEVGQQTSFSSDIMVDLHGVSNQYEVRFVLTRLSADKVLVQSAQAVAVHAKDFTLMPGLNKLQQLAKLPSITPVVAVRFTLVFEGA